jgi:hypothetical protein
MQMYYKVQSGVMQTYYMVQSCTTHSGRPLHSCVHYLSSNVVQLSSLPDNVQITHATHHLQDMAPTCSHRAGCEPKKQASRLRADAAAAVLSLLAKTLGNRLIKPTGAASSQPAEANRP